MATDNIWKSFNHYNFIFSLTLSLSFSPLPSVYKIILLFSNCRVYALAAAIDVRGQRTARARDAQHTR